MRLGVCRNVRQVLTLEFREGVFHGDLLPALMFSGRYARTACGDARAAQQTARLLKQHATSVHRGPILKDAPGDAITCGQMFDSAR